METNTNRFGGGGVGEIHEIREAIEAGRHEEALALYHVHMASAAWVSPEMHYLGGRAALAYGNQYGARQALERAIETGAHGELRGKALLVLGLSCRRVGDVVMAEQHLTTFLDEMPREYPQLGPMWRGSALNSLALTYRQRGRFIEAREHYLAAAVEFRQEGLRNELAQVLWSLAWVLCLLEDGAGARAALDESEALRSDELARWHQTLGRAFCEAMEGWQDSTTQRLTRIMQAATAPPDVVAHAYWLTGREAFRQSDLPKALTMAEQAIQIAQTDTNDTRAHRDAIDLRQAVLQAMNPKDQAAGA